MTTGDIVNVNVMARTLPPAEQRVGIAFDVWLIGTRAACGSEQHEISVKYARGPIVFFGKEINGSHRNLL